MTAEQEKFLEEIDKRYARMRNALFAIIGILISAWVVQFYLSGVKLGRLEATVEKNINDIDFLEENFMPFWYGDGMVKLFNIHTERIVATIGGDDLQVKRLNEDFQRQFEVIQQSIIKVREGFNPKITRGLAPDTNEKFAK